MPGPTRLVQAGSLACREALLANFSVELGDYKSLSTVVQTHDELGNWSSDLLVQHQADNYRRIKEYADEVEARVRSELRWLVNDTVANYTQLGTPRADFVHDLSRALRRLIAAAYSPHEDSLRTLEDPLAAPKWVTAEEEWGARRTVSEQLCEQLIAQAALHQESVVSGFARGLQAAITSSFPTVLKEKVRVHAWRPKPSFFSALPGS